MRDLVTETGYLLEKRIKNEGILKCYTRDVQSTKSKVNLAFILRSSRSSESSPLKFP